MRSARLRFPLSMSLLVKRATFRLLYLASGTSGRRTALLRLGTICLLINHGTCFVLFYYRKSGVLRGGAPLRGAGCPRSSPSLTRHGTCFVLFYYRKSGVLRGGAPLRGAGCPRSSSSLTRHRRWQVITDTRKGVDSIVRAPLQSLSDAYTRMPFQIHCQLPYSILETNRDQCNGEHPTLIANLLVSPQRIETWAS